MRRRDKNETEHLRGEIRKLTREVAQLRKRLQKYQEHDVSSESEEYTQAPKQKKHICPVCYGDIKQIVIEGVRIIDECTECNYRKAKKWQT